VGFLSCGPRSPTPGAFLLPAIHSCASFKGKTMTSHAQDQADQSSNLKFYTVTEVAAVLDVSPALVYGWIKDESLPAIRLGPKLLRIREQDLQAFIERGMSEGADEQDRE
jgi:excisionase family DNA binding protein